MSSTNSAKEKALKLDEEYPSHSDLFQFPTFSTMGLSAPSEATGKTIDTRLNYLCGNSLGLMPISTPGAINAELKAWGDRAVESHFRHGDNLTDWVDIDLPVVPLLAKVVGAKETEVACMGTLTMNLNSLLCSFYKPQGSRRKILFEKHAFPSDYYAMLNQVRLHGYDESALIQMAPKEGKTYLETEDILDVIAKQGDEIAVVCFSGIQYYTGQFFDIATITKAGHEAGCVVGWDLAHAVGNVELQLHDWDVDFAAWCSYKYLNSGPGGIGGFFVNDKHSTEGRPRLAGWWGNNAEDRFKMLEKFEPISGALGYRQSNPSVIDVVSLHSALDTFEKCGGIKTLRARSKKLTGFLESLLKDSKYYEAKTSPYFIILTPSDPEARGTQLSVLFGPHSDDKTKDVMERVFGYLNDRGVICDDRRPNVIRLAPVASYNTFSDCAECVEILEEALALCEGEE